MTDHSIDEFLGAAPSRKLHRWITFVALCVALVAAFMLLERFLNGGPALWYTALVEKGDLDPAVSIDATLHAEGETVLRAPQDGVIDSVAGPDFSAVTPGESLVVFDTTALDRQADQAQIMVRAAKSDLDTAQFTNAEAASRLARYQHVWQQSHGRVPALNEMDDARLAADRSAAAVDKARAGLDLARSQRTSVQDQAAAAFVRVPLAGFIVARHVVPGQFVRLGAPLITLAGDLDHLLIQGILPGAKAITLPRNTRARVLIAASPGEVRTARLVRTDVGDGNVGLAVFALDGAAGALRPAMPVELEFSLPTRNDVMLVPNSALSFSPPGTPHGTGTLYLLGRDGQLRLIHVATGGTDGKRTEVQGAKLEVGQEVVIGARQNPPSQPPAGGNSQLPTRASRANP